MKESLLYLWVNKERLGTLKKSTNRRLMFQYDPSWIESHPNLPISRKLPVQEEAHRGDIVEAYLKNLLPDSQTMLNQLAAIHKTRDTDVFSLLEVMGKDCVGALRFLRQGEKSNSDLTEREAISTSEIAAILKNLQGAPLGQQSDHEFFRISIAGAQEKTALLKIGKKWFKPKGSTPTTHILKPAVDLDFDGTSISIAPENEWLCLKICELYGLRVARASIEIFGEKKTLVVERFDREWSKDQTSIYRLIQEDFCQATGTPPHMKYESKGGPGIKTILEILSESKQPQVDRYHFFKTQLVFFLLAAIDGHAKNFSIQWSDTGLSLTPLYDVISADPLVAKKKLSKQKIALAMAVEGKRKHYRISDISKRHWAETARRAKISEKDLNQIFEEVIFVSKKLPELLAPHLPVKFPLDTLEPILDGVKTRLKFI